jgi:hypothetical protein
MYPPWPNPEMSAAQAKEALPGLVEGFFRDGNSALVTTLGGDRVAIGIFAAPEPGKLMLQQDTPAVLLEADRDRSGDVWLGIHPANSIRAAGSCPVNKCVTIHLQNDTLMSATEQTESNPEGARIEPGFATILAANGLRLLIEYGGAMGYDPIPGIGSPRDEAVTLMKPGKHRFLVTPFYVDKPELTFLALGTGITSPLQKPERR